MVFKFASEQRFGNWSRWLVTFEKVSEPVEGERTTLRNNGNKTNFRDLYFNKGLADADNNVDEDR